MKGIILAAGRGSRMGDITEDQPKCKTQLLGKPLIEWQIETLQKAGMEQVGIVTGYLANTFNYPVNYFHNPDWAVTNMVSTLLCADSWLQNNDCIVSYSDIVYAVDDAQRLAQCSEAQLAITYDPLWLELWQRRFADPLDDAETFKTDSRGLLREIGAKASCVEEIQGQYMGLLKFTPSGWQQVKAYLHTLTPERLARLDMTSLLSALLRENINIVTVAINDRWYEVDNRNDLALYETLADENGGRLFNTQ